MQTVVTAPVAKVFERIRENICWLLRIIPLLRSVLTVKQKTVVITEISSVRQKKLPLMVQGPKEEWKLPAKPLRKNKDYSQSKKGLYYKNGKENKRNT